MESRDSKLIADGRAWSVDGRAQALVGPGLATPLDTPLQKNTTYGGREGSRAHAVAPVLCGTAARDADATGVSPLRPL